VPILSLYGFLQLSNFRDNRVLSGKVKRLLLQSKIGQRSTPYEARQGRKATRITARVAVVLATAFLAIQFDLTHS